MFNKGNLKLFISQKEINFNQTIKNAKHWLTVMSCTKVENELGTWVEDEDWHWLNENDQRFEPRKRNLHEKCVNHIHQEQATIWWDNQLHHKNSLHHRQSHTNSCPTSFHSISKKRQKINNGKPDILHPFLSSLSFDRSYLQV